MVNTCMYENKLKETLIFFKWNFHAYVRNVQRSFSYEETVGGDRRGCREYNIVVNKNVVNR